MLGVTRPSPAEPSSCCRSRPRTSAGRVRAGPDPGVAPARGRDRTPRRPRGHRRGRLDAGGRRRPADRSAAATRVPDRGARDDQDAVRRHDRPDAPDHPDGTGRGDPVVPAATHHLRQRDRHGRGWAGACLRGRRRLPGLRRGRGRRPVRGLRRDGARPRQRPARPPGGGGVPQRTTVRPDPDRDGGAHRHRGRPDLPGRGVRHRPARRAAHGDRPLRVGQRGHLEPLVLREGRAVKILEVPPMLPFGLGRSFAAPGTAATVGFEQLQPGDLLLLYTDGVTEARSPRATSSVSTGSSTSWCATSPPGSPHRRRCAGRSGPCSSTSPETSATTPPSSSSSGTATPRACSGPEEPAATPPARPLISSALELARWAQGRTERSRHARRSHHWGLAGVGARPRRRPWPTRAGWSSATPGTRSR